MAHVGEVLERAHSLFGAPAVGESLGSGPALLGAGALVRGGAAQMGGQSGVLPSSYGVFAAGAGPALDSAAAADDALNGQVGAAAASDGSGRATSGAVLSGASADTSTLAPWSGTPAGQRALVAALRARVAEQLQVINAYKQRDARLAAMLRSLPYAQRGGGGAPSMPSIPSFGGGGGGGGLGGLAGLGSALGGLTNPGGGHHNVTLAGNVSPGGADSSGLPVAGPGVGEPLGLLTLNSSKREVVAAIIREARRHGYSPYQTTAIIADCLQESNANPKAVSPNGLWIGPFQQDASYAGRRNPNLAIQEFFTRLDQHGGPRSADIWKSIFWLQQRPGESSAESAVAHGRAAYLTEIKSKHPAAIALYRDIVGGAAL